MGRSARSRALWALGATMLLVAGGCGADVEDSEASGSEAERSGPITVENCGAEVTYDQAPERAVTFNLAMAEQMFALGLADHMQGYVVGRFRNLGIETSEFQDEFADVERLGDNNLSLEIVLDAGADWVYAGYNNGFAESRGITPEILADNGVESYVMSETCAGGDLEPLGALEALEADFHNLGEIFGVQDRAEEVVADIEERLDNASADAPDRPARVLLSDVSEGAPWVPGASSIASLVIESAGAENITDDIEQPWGSVGFETIVERDPEVIFIQDYDVPFEEKRDILVNNPTMRNVTAVREGNVFPIDYADTTNGPRVGEATERMAEKLRSIGM